MMGIDDLAAGIVAGVGGAANIRSVGHCTTRLRLVLADRAAADRDVVRALPGVMSTVERGGQFQVVIGQHVGQVDTRVRSLVSAANDGAPVDEAPLAMTPGWTERSTCSPARSTRCSGRSSGPA